MQGGRYNGGMDEIAQARFHALRQRALQGHSLTEAETAELSQFMAAIEAEEREALRPGREAQEAQLIATERRISELRQLVARREALAAYLRRVLEETNAEREAIDLAFRRLMDTSESASLQQIGAT